MMSVLKLKSFGCFYITDPIANNYKTCVCPFIDVIDYETFEYKAQDEGARGGFDWEFYYKRLPLLPESIANPTEPFKYIYIYIYLVNVSYRIILYCML